MDKLWINPKIKKKRNKRKNLKEYYILLNNIIKNTHTHTQKTTYKQPKKILLTI